MVFEFLFIVTKQQNFHDTYIVTYSDSELFWGLCNIISTESVIHRKHVIPANKSSFKHLGFSPRIKHKNY